MRLIIMATLMAVTACSSQPVATSYYLLRSDVQQTSGQLNPSTEFRLGSLTVADYIDRPGLVLETGAGQIHTALNHQWAEPLRNSLKSLLAVEISSRLGEDVFFDSTLPAATEVAIRIDQLHGDSSGQAVLVAYWRLTSPEQKERVFQFSETRSLQQDGYAALADAEKILVQQLAARIADSLTATGA